MSGTTPGLAPDEKVCPYCAETIKAAAVKCRFCQSELPATVEPVSLDKPDAGPAVATEPPVAAEPEAESSADAEPPAAAEPSTNSGDVVESSEVEPVPEAEPAPVAGAAGTSLTTRLVVGLVVLCLVLAGVLGYLVHRARNPQLDTAPNGQVTQNSFRNAAMSAASDAAAKALSYSYKSFDADRKTARASMGPTLARQYDKAMDGVAAQTANAKLSLKATVLSAGLLSATEHRAKVLLFVNTVTTTEGSKKQQLDQNRVVMTLTRKDGGWTVTKMDAF